jgi:hypothetical protein
VSAAGVQAGSAGWKSDEETGATWQLQVTIKSLCSSGQPNGGQVTGARVGDEEENPSPRQSLRANKKRNHV